MTPHLLAQDPSTLILRLINGSVDAPVGYDMPAGVSRCIQLTLSAGSYQTPITQQWTLAVAAYDTTDNVLDYYSARDLWLAAVQTLLDNSTTSPLCDVRVQSGPLVNHDTELHVDYVYGTLTLTVSV